MAPTNDARITLVLPKEKLDEFRELAREETGPLPRFNGDPHAPKVLRRLVEEYIASRRAMRPGGV